MESGKFNGKSNTLQHFDVLGICIFVSAHAIIKRVCYCTYRRGLGVACSDLRAIPEPHVAEQQQCSPAFFVCKKELSKKKTFTYMRKTRLLLALLCAWVGLVPLAAQSVRITKEMTLHPFATVLPMYKNEFGSFEKPKMDDTFPFAVIRMQLEGNAQAVKAAKELFTLDMGQMTGVESKCTAYSNQILFLVPARRPYIYIDCGDGCDQVLLSNMQQLKSNRIYDCTVHFVPERDENAVVEVVDKDVLLDELRAELANMMQAQQKSQNEEAEIEEQQVDSTIVAYSDSVVQDTLSNYQRYVRNAKIRTLVMGQLGYSITPQMSYGAMIGQMYNGYGWFISGRSNFNFTKPSEGLVCTEGGWIGDELPFYKGSTSSNWNVNVGFICDILALTLKPQNHFHSLGLYIGAGYGRYERLWQMSDDRWVRYAPSFTSGVSTDIGIIGSFYGVTLTVGVNTINFKYMDIEVGIGYMF